MCFSSQVETRDYNLIDLPAWTRYNLYGWSLPFGILRSTAKTRERGDQVSLSIKGFAVF
jgi:hypothetical protein